MHGVVSLLDKTHYFLVEEIWQELQHEFGVQGVYVTPYPHFSYLVATHYDFEFLETLLQDFTSRQVSFQVRTTGLGIFTGEHPVIYIPVVRTPELTQFHEALWKQTHKVGSDIQAFYSPEQWMPHITIGFGDIRHEILPQIVSYLGKRDFNWTITIDNITTIYDTGVKQELRKSITLISKEERRRRTLEWLHQKQEERKQHPKEDLYTDSAEMIRQMREERTQHLLDVVSGKYNEDEFPNT